VACVQAPATGVAVGVGTAVGVGDAVTVGEGEATELICSVPVPVEKSDTFEVLIAETVIV
jgi:hypothetical protein